MTPLGSGAVLLIIMALSLLLVAALCVAMRGGDPMVRALTILTISPIWFFVVLVSLLLARSKGWIE